MKNTGIKIEKLSHDEMLNHSNKEYNQSVWKRRVSSYIELGATFYESKPNGAFSYSRFYVEYKADGLYFFSEFNAYSVSMTNYGFARIFIKDNTINVFGFGEDGKQRVKNSNDGRAWLRNNICKYDVMISSNF